MRYLCLNQAGQRNKIQAPTIADNLHKRDLEETMGYEVTNRDGLVPTRKAKRFRSAFTTEQIKYLETEFKKYPYIGSARRKEVSNALNITERAVKIWFQNRRMKEKKDRTSNETDCEEHKNSRKVDVANDQLNNECTVTSTNNQHYALLPLMSPKNITTKNIESLEKENEIDVLSDERPNRKVIIDTKNSNNKASAEFSIELYKQYNNYIAKPEHIKVNPTLQKKKHVNPAINSTHDVSSTSPYEKLPQDLSRKRKQPQVKTMGTPQIPTGGYFPLNLKKYNAQPSLPVGGSMVWKPVQVVPVMPGSGMTISSDQMESLSMATLPAQGAKDCCCDCRCHPSPSGPVLLQQSATNPLAQYVLTALPLPNPYFEY